MLVDWPLEQLREYQDDIDYVATEVPVEQRGPIIAVYRPLAGKVVEGYWKQMPDDADHPTFALSPR